MRTGNAMFTPVAIVMALTMSGCDLFHKTSTRETIFDKVVSIPNELVLDIPNLPPLCDELPDLKKGFVDILDGKLYYEEEGQGIPLVLINGGPGGTHHCFHPYFSQIKDLAHIIYYDQRGTGKSSSDDTGKMYTVKQAVEDLERLRKALKIEKWAILGHSYGGLLAQCYALTYPQHCIGLILAASSTGISDNTMQPVRENVFISQAEKNAIDSIRKMANEGKLTSAQCIYNTNLAGDWKRWFYHKPTDMDALARVSLYGHNPAPGFEETMRKESDQKIPQSDFLKGKFDDFEIPTLIAEAKWEMAWWDPNRIEVMSKNHPHAQVEVFKKSGHMIFIDEPEKFFDILQKFLEKTDKPLHDISFVIVDFNSGETVKMDGDCQSQESPCSTFKIALSLMGFDAGILKNESEPEWQYKDEYNAALDIWKQPHTPKTWIKNSCIWYSQKLTPILGMERFQNYVNAFDYGNKDLSGDIGKKNGLSRSWPCSSLKISPLEQIEFIKKLLQKKLPVSEYAHEQTQNILYVMELADGWKLYGKTGGGVYDDDIKSVGWHVGWVTNDKIRKTLIFACLLKSKDGKIVVNGNLAKENMLKFLNEGCHANY